MQELKDKGVLITGAGRGIGKRLAIGFAGEGAKLGLLARSRAELELTQLEIEHSGGAALRLRADVRDPEQMKAAVERMHAHFGDIHVLVCNAGVQGPVGPFLENNPKLWAETVETNLFGVMHSCAAVLPEMVERRRGKVLVVGGSGTARPRPNFTAYAASKSAVARFVETLAEELRDHNVQINCMAPGDTYTHMTDEILKAGEKAGEKDQAEALEVRITGGTGPEKQIALALFLASERSNHVSGKLISVKDDWKRLENTSVHPEVYTLRRVKKL
ncbi:MAG: SDR family oxidoreductase [Acidobacteriia bacterium]|nr:SDR family oxidoreductase [Terriglobia bacterium]